jgi:hypothetical protein
MPAAAAALTAARSLGEGSLRNASPDGCPPPRRRGSSASNMTLGEQHFPIMSRIVKSKRFEIAIGIVIVVNCLTMGVEAELMLGKGKDLDMFVQISEHLITAIF